MSTIADKLRTILDIKEAIRQAIIDENVEVPEETPFADYPDKIREIHDKNLDLWNIITANGTSASSLLEKRNLTGHVDMNEFESDNLITLHSMFRDNPELESVDLSEWVTISANTRYMFKNCVALKSINLSNLDLSNAVLDDVGEMFAECRSLVELRLDNCNYATLTLLFYHEINFLPIYNDGSEHLIYCKEANVGDLTVPEGWTLVFVE
jgi:surface protein